jgi:hypothetical protein
MLYAPPKCWYLHNNMQGVTLLKLETSSTRLWEPHISQTVRCARCEAFRVIGDVRVWQYSTNCLRRSLASSHFESDTSVPPASNCPPLGYINFWGSKSLKVFRFHTLLSSPDVAPCHLLATDHSFGGKYYFHVQVRRAQQRKTHR